MWKKILIVVLVLLLLGGGAFLYCQNHLVYDENGRCTWSCHLSARRSLRPSPPGGEQDPNDIDFTREEPQGPVIETIAAKELAANALESDPSATLPAEQKTVVLDVKLADGTYTYKPSFQAAGTVGSAVSTENLKKLTAADKYVIARVSALGDTAYAKAHVEDAGLLRHLGPVALV